MKKLLGILSSLTIAATAFAGCGGDSPAPGSSNTGGDGSSKESSAGTSSAVSGEKVTIRVFGPNNVEEFPAGQDENNNRILDYIEEHTGYDLIWEIAPKENAREKVNLMLTSGVDCPDMIVNGDRNWGLDFVKEEMVYPLDEYLANTVNLKGLLTEDANKMMTFDGKLYGIVVPQNQEATNGFIIRQDWLDKAGVSVPTTLDEFRSVLQAFKDMEPNCIPLTGGAGDSGTWGVDGFKGAFGVATEWRETSDGKLENSLITQDMKDYLTFCAGLYADGLLDKEYVVNKTDQLNEKIVSSRSGMRYTGWADVKNLRDGLAEKDPNASFAYAYPAGPDGRTGAVMNSPARIYFWVPVHSEIPDKVIDFLDKYVEKDVRMVVSYGWENEEYTIDADGIINATEKAEEIRYRIYYQLWDSKEDFLNRCKLKGFWPDYEPYKAFSTVKDPMWYAPVITELQDNKTTLSDLQAQYFIKFITGALPMEKFEEFVSQWKASGGDVVTEAVNNWYTNQ